MRNGKKLTASSIFTIIGVICFAAVLVTAAVVTLGSITQINKTVVDTGLSVSTVAFTATANDHTDFLTIPNPVKNIPYDFATQFTATGPDANGWYRVVVSGTGVTALGSVVLKYWAVTDWSTAVVGTFDDVDSIEFVVDNGGWAAGTITQGFEITLTQAGDFAVDIDVVTGSP
jgi:hypothetical protein